MKQTNENKLTDIVETSTYNVSEIVETINIGTDNAETTILNIFEMVENEIHETDNNANVNNESGNDNITDLEKNVDDNLIDLEQSSGNYSTDMDNPTERNIIETLNENLDNKKEFSTTENIPQNESSVIESQDRSQRSNSTISIRKIIPSRNMEQNKIDKFLNTSIKYDKFEVEDNLIIGSYDASKYNIDIKINTDKDVFITFKKIKQTEMISRNDSITSSLSIIQQNEESLPKKNLLESSLFKNLKCAVNYVESTRMYSYIIIKPEWNNHKDYNIMLHDKYDNNEDIKIICIIKYLERINDKYFSFILDIKKNINFSSRRKKVSEHRIVRYIYEATRMVLLHCYRIDNNWIKCTLIALIRVSTSHRYMDLIESIAAYGIKLVDANGTSNKLADELSRVFQTNTAQRTRRSHKQNQIITR